jgi:LAO/AO transport system kinase
VLVVNKGDREGAELTLQQLLGALSIRSMRAQVPVLKTTATTGEGVPELVQTIRDLGARGADASPMARRRRRARYLIARAAADIVARRVKESHGGEIDRLADEVLSGRVSPDVAASKLLGRS